jgi:hypothetical protein
MRKSVWSFLLCELLFLVLLFAVGLILLAPNITVIDNTFVGIGNYLPKIGIVFVLAVVLTLIQSFLFLKLCLGIPVSGIKKRFEESHNDSHAYLIGGIAASVAVALVFSSGVNLHQYLYSLCIKAPVGYLFAVLATTVVARIFGVKSMQEFRNWINTPDNDSYAILVSVIMVVSMILAMGVA